MNLTQSRTAILELPAVPGLVDFGAARVAAQETGTHSIELTDLE